MHNKSYKKNNFTKSNSLLISIKDLKELEQDFQNLKIYIKEAKLKNFIDIISNSEDKYFLEHNEKDYEIFLYAIKHFKGEFIKAMINHNYILNPNMLLIELYELYIKKKEKQVISNKEEELSESDNSVDIFSVEQINYMINNNYGIFSQDIIKTDITKNDKKNKHITNRNEYNININIIDNNQNSYIKDCTLEFYFLLMTEFYSSAVRLLEKSSSIYIKETLNKTFIGDEVNLIERILTNSDISKKVICSALQRNLDGVAYEIYNYSSVDIDEDIIKCAVEGNCSLFLEDVWESTIKYGNLKIKYGKKIPFSQYIQIMLDNNKYDMASYAIKNWYEAYKEESIFERIVEKSEELAVYIYYINNIVY